MDTSTTVRTARYLTSLWKSDPKKGKPRARGSTWSPLSPDAGPQGQELAMNCQPKPAGGALVPPPQMSRGWAKPVLKCRVPDLAFYSFLEGKGVGIQAQIKMIKWSI